MGIRKTLAVEGVQVCCVEISYTTDLPDVVSAGVPIAIFCPRGRLDRPFTRRKNLFVPLTTDRCTPGGCFHRDPATENSGPITTANAQRELVGGNLATSLIREHDHKTAASSKHDGDDIGYSNMYIEMSSNRDCISTQGRHLLSTRRPLGRG